MKKKLYTAFILCTLCTFFFACKPFDDLIVKDVQQDWAVPLVNTTFSVKNLLAKFDTLAYVQFAADSTLVLHYKGSFFSRSSFDIFASYQNAIFPVTDTVMSVPFTVPNGVHVDNVVVKSGTLVWVFKAPEQVNVHLTIPSLQKNGVIFERNFSCGTTGVIQTLDMSGWTMTPSNDSIIIIHDARNAAGQRLNLKGNAGFQIKDFVFGFVKGFLGRDTFDIPQDTIKFDFFKNLSAGDVKFESPRLTVTLDNSYGVPVQSIMKIGNVIARDGSKLAITSPLVNGLNINYPKLTEIGQSKQTVVVLDKTNSNLQDIISFKPVALEYKIVGVMNPDNTAKTIGFLTDSSIYKLQVDMDLPVHLRASNFIMRDTSALSLNAQPSATYATFFVTTESTIPADLAVQGYFLAADNSVVDSLSVGKNLLINGAPVDANGYPTQSQTTQLSTTFLQPRLKNILAKAQKIAWVYNVATTGGGVKAARITAKQTVNVHLSIQFGIQK